MGSQDKIVFINLQNTSNSLRKRAAYSKRFLNLRAKYCQPWKSFRAADCFYRLFFLSRRSYPRRYQDSIISVPYWHLQGNYQLERQPAVNFSQSLPEPVIWSHQLLSFAQHKVQQLWSQGQPGVFFLACLDSTQPGALAATRLLLGSSVPGPQRCHHKQTFSDEFSSVRPHLLFARRGIMWDAAESSYFLALTWRPGESLHPPPQSGHCPPKNCGKRSRRTFPKKSAGIFLSWSFHRITWFQEMTL